MGDQINLRSLQGLETGMRVLRFLYHHLPGLAELKPKAIFNTSRFAISLSQGVPSSS